MKRDKEKLKRWMIRRRLEGWKVTRICAHAGVSRDMFYRWWGRYQRQGWEGAEGEVQSPRRTCTKHPGRPLSWWCASGGRGTGGPSKIEGYLRNKQDKVKPIGHNTIYRITCDAGLNNPLDKPRKTWDRKRFERSHSNSLWQADYKLAEDDNWMLTYLDDHSRFVQGIGEVLQPYR